jgi:hypothetical protein
MTIIDYLLVGVVAITAFYIDYRLFLGSRKSTLGQNEGRTKAVPLNAYNFES